MKRNLLYITLILLSSGLLAQEDNKSFKDFFLGGSINYHIIDTNKDQMNGNSFTGDRKSFTSGLHLGWRFSDHSAIGLRLLFEDAEFPSTPMFVNIVFGEGIESITTHGLELFIAITCQSKMISTLLQNLIQRIYYQLRVLLLLWKK